MRRLIEAVLARRFGSGHLPGRRLDRWGDNLGFRRLFDGHRLSRPCRRLGPKRRGVLYEGSALHRRQGRRDFPPCVGWRWGGLRDLFYSGELSGLPLERRSDPRLQSTRQIRRIRAIHKRLAGAGPVQPIMLGNQGAPFSLAHLRHALDGFDPLVLAGVVERGRAAQDLLSKALRCGLDGGEQLLPLLTLIQVTARQSRKGKAYESCRENDGSEQYGIHPPDCAADITARVPITAYRPPLTPMLAPIEPRFSS